MKRYGKLEFSFKNLIDLIRCNKSMILIVILVEYN